MKADAFRENLILRLSVLHVVKQASLHGAPAGMAALLGVTEETLQASLTVSRSGFGPSRDEGGLLTEIHVHLPVPLIPSFFGASAQLKIPHNVLLRSLLHTMMQLPREPSRRARGNWETTSEHASHRRSLSARGADRAALNASSSNLHLSVSVTRALLTAVDLRATANGASRNSYGCLWIADLVDGLLRDASIRPVRNTQMFSTETAYVLPILQGTEKKK